MTQTTFFDAHIGPWSPRTETPTLVTGRQTLAATPASHRDDPESSKQAEERVTKSGVRSKQARICLEVLADYNGRSSRALAQCTNRLDRYQLARRLPELEKLGLVRRETPPGGGDTKWFLTDRGNAANKQGD